MSSVSCLCSPRAPACNVGVCITCVCVGLCFLSVCFVGVSVCDICVCGVCALHGGDCVMWLRTELTWAECHTPGIERSRYQTKGHWIY